MPFHGNQNKKGSFFFFCFFFPIKIWTFLIKTKKTECISLKIKD